MVQYPDGGSSKDALYGGKSSVKLVTAPHALAERISVVRVAGGLRESERREGRLEAREKRLERMVRLAGARLVSMPDRNRVKMPKRPSN